MTDTNQVLLLIERLTAQAFQAGRLYANIWGENEAVDTDDIAAFQQAQNEKLVTVRKLVDAVTATDKQM